MAELTTSTQKLIVVSYRKWFIMKAFHSLSRENLALYKYDNFAEIVT